jgi:hypothetical protein
LIWPESFKPWLLPIDAVAGTGVGHVDAMSLVPHPIDLGLDDRTVEVGQVSFPGIFRTNERIALFKFQCTMGSDEA